MKKSGSDAMVVHHFSDQTQNTINSVTLGNPFSRAEKKDLADLLLNALLYGMIIAGALLITAYFAGFIGERAF